MLLIYFLYFIQFLVEEFRVFYLKFTVLEFPLAFIFPFKQFLESVHVFMESLGPSWFEVNQSDDLVRNVGEVK